ncbi:MAG: hypothetical protein A3D96_07350 [Chlamydiae bacterium RIFCSPHIGHO2_12_FULL_44_59]|nr:MAG: hypothetical protein A3C42_02445 [Chlamydiae bacterium RIFCSPHIGHO2_02_FULL_45_9]OGN56850.1 MAG: hypothetical protein A2796_06660 [Chlamydiae bacterium RIFCSPHIGHO2_01_FULL_44_39]OGN59508.1 MAG: hypothetical protein A3D96_07350 [Chlamydiae bacterium RIFCSPHIGHO2_12_FULL_44_59]OGN67253.1 MAG: hypothetical protein A2978_03180 [Chlamydiae bacterium RIFCSPLOWO2_01_FULL_44_52]OGN68675.1 MAG: hypothetical protein A3I67_02910 [Chlamydiae bacterium RIFCSPLOWO2_02_FULL_45_22]OGN69196.1 MAG: hyp
MATISLITTQIGMAQGIITECISPIILPTLHGGEVTVTTEDRIITDTGTTTAAITIATASKELLKPPFSKSKGAKEESSGNWRAYKQSASRLASWEKTSER